MRLPDLRSLLTRARLAEAGRVAGFLVLTMLLSLMVGVATAQASSPVGPHQAQWSTTLDSRLTLDLGPLGTASLDSPAAPLGGRVVIGEIPAVVAGDPAATASATPTASATATPEASGSSEAPDTSKPAAALLGSALKSDGASYLALVAHPEITVEAGVRALVNDALRRAGLVEAILLTLTAGGHLATGGHLRATLRRGSHHRMGTALVGATMVSVLVAVSVPAMRTTTPAGTTMSALAGTPVAQAKLSGRLADVVQTYGPTVRGVLKDNEAFYAQVRTNLNTAWATSHDLDGMVDVTVSDGTIPARTLSELRMRARIREASEQDQWAEATAQASAQATDSASPEVTATAPESSDATQPPTTGEDTDSGEASASVIPSEGSKDQGAWPVPTGALAAQREGAITATLTTDLHCNLDMMEVAGRLDALSGADVHLDDGDLTMTGSEPEQVCVDGLTRAVPRGVERVITIGNHDSDLTATQLRSRGWKVTNGKPLTAAGLTILGAVDADRSPATGTVKRGNLTSAQVGENLAAASCNAGNVDVVLIHQPYTFGPLVARGCAPLLVAGHSHQEYGMSVLAGTHGPVAQLRSGFGQGGTSIGKVRTDAYLHVLSFNEEGQLLAWRAVVVHADASVTVGAWHGVGPVGTVGEGIAAGLKAAQAPIAATAAQSATGATDAATAGSSDPAAESPAEPVTDPAAGLASDLASAEAADAGQ